VTPEQVEELVDSDPPPDMPCECGCGQLAEVVLPVGETAMMTCWRCAHVVTEHEMPATEAAACACDCPVGEIYPRWS